MPWGRLDDRANSDAKLLALSDAAWRMWGCGIIYCQFNLTDGFIPDHAIHTFGVRAKNKEAVAEELCASLVPNKGPLWHRVEGGYRVHDFLAWNDSKATVEAERAGGKDRWQRWKQRVGKRSRKRVSNGVANGDTNDAPNDLANGPATSLHVPRTIRELSTEPESSRRVRARAFDGQRLHVSEKQHQVVLDEVGPMAEHLDFPALYASWDAQLVASGEVFDALVFIKRRAVEVVQSLRRCGVVYRDPDDEVQALQREAAEERRRTEERDQVEQLWRLLDSGARRALQELAVLELKAFLPRMTETRRSEAIEHGARRLLGERFPGRDQKAAELARLREGAAVA